ncbi:MAG: hypothetical protein R3Y04_01430 [Rikenellaceae bacterium]
MKKLSKLNFNSIKESELLSDEIMNQIEAGEYNCKSCTVSCKKGGSESYKL